MAVEVGQVLDGKYRIVRLLGAGGMGAVYEATHLLIDRRVALKELHADAAAADNAIARFEREARAAGRIGSDHILQIFDVGTLPNGSRYMVSEFLDGETLDARIRRAGRLTAAELYPVAQQLLTGLEAAHQALVLHRDLKPDNIFLVRQKSGVADFVKIIDFGIAKFQSGQSHGDALKMTKTGMVVGTPYYLSPEQAQGAGDADARSDLYSVGVILYECVTGEVPFSAQNFNELIFKIVLQEPVPPANRAPGIDRRLSDLILKAMARDPAARFQSAQEMKAALAAWAASTEGSATLSFAPPPATLPHAQTVFASSERGTPPVASRPHPVPTPASFGATRDPHLATLALPLRKSSLLLLPLGGLLLLLLGAGAFMFRHAQTTHGTAASAVQPPASSIVNAPLSNAPPAIPTRAPGNVTSPVLSQPAPSPRNESAPHAQLPSKLAVASHAATQKVAAPAPVPVPVPVPVPPAPAPVPAADPTPAPAVHAAPAEPEPNPAPKDRANWGY